MRPHVSVRWEHGEIDALEPALEELVRREEARAELPKRLGVGRRGRGRRRGGSRSGAHMSGGGGGVGAGVTTARLWLAAPFEGGSARRGRC